MDVFTDVESEVRSYCRSWPAVFTTASGSWLFDEQDRRFLDFFAGAGALNYGHNDPRVTEPMIDYLRSGGVLHSLDMSTQAKRTFLERFGEVILAPRSLDYKVQFPGPTGTNAVEAALKLARKVTGRESVFSFTNAFHGMTLGALSVTGNSMKRGGAGVPLSHATVMPYCNYLDEGSSLAYLDSMLTDSGSGVDLPAAVIVETTQGEGGLKASSASWLRRLRDLCHSHDMLLIVDDIQMGCGRTGPFFSFEGTGVVPDIVCLSKSISGSGQPLALTLMRPQYDVWEPGEHNGTFRGNNLAFVSATAALETFWSDDTLQKDVDRRAGIVEDGLLAIAARYADAGAETRGRGLAQGIAFEDHDVAGAVCAEAFQRGLIMETSGPESEVIKVMPPLTISDEDLRTGMGLLAECTDAVATDRGLVPQVSS
jgi:diaminobutyrate-2-oxoglutarate transaminase